MRHPSLVGIPTTANLVANSRLLGSDLDEATRVWEADVRTVMAGLKHAPVEEGAGSDHPLHWTQVRPHPHNSTLLTSWVQIHCILGDVSEVLSLVADRLTGGLDTYVGPLLSCLFNHEVVFAGCVEIGFDSLRICVFSSQ